MFDQTPVRLKIWSDGKIYVSSEEVDQAARHQQLRDQKRRRKASAEAVQRELMAEASANPDRAQESRQLVAVGGDKHRYTLVTFQCIQNWLDPDKEPEGSMPTPVLIVYCEKHCRLEDIDQEGQFNKTVRFVWSHLDR